MMIYPLVDFSVQCFSVWTRLLIAEADRLDLSVTLCEIRGCVCLTGSSVVAQRRRALKCIMPFDSQACLKVTVDYITFCSFTNQYLHCWSTLCSLCLLWGSVFHCNKAYVWVCLCPFAFVCVSSFYGCGKIYLKANHLATCKREVIILAWVSLWLAIRHHVVRRLPSRLSLINIRQKKKRIS